MEANGSTEPAQEFRPLPARPICVGALLMVLVAGGCGSTVTCDSVRSGDSNRDSSRRVCVDAVLSAARPLAPGESIGVRVDAKCRTNRTGVSVLQGREYTIRVDESSHPDQEPWKDWFVDATVEQGWTGLARPFGWLLKWFAVAPGAPMYALAGAIEGGTPFYVGSELNFRASESGELVLFANDVEGLYFNNRGCLDVTIERMTSGNTLAPGMPEKLQISVLIVETSAE